jgi:stress response protein YsnF
VQAGNVCELGAAVVSQANDGERTILLAADSEQSPKGSIGDAKLTLLAEELSVAKETVETGRLRASKQTRTREAFIDENLRSEHAEIETIPIGRQIFEMPSVRHEGDTTIIPIVEGASHRAAVDLERRNQDYPATRNRTIS